MTETATAVVQTEQASHAWNDLAGRVQAFVRAWETGPEPPALAAFLADAPEAVRRPTLIELIKIDLDYRWSKGRGPRRVEEYLAAFPELADGGPPCDLIYEEFHVRKRAGEAVEARDFVARFPGRAAELDRLLALESSQLSTRLVAEAPLEAVEPGGNIDDFDLLALLGKGAFARVFLARQRSMQRLVALKVSADTGQEPQTLAQLDHPHIVRVHDQRTAASRSLRLLYMQYVAGGTLHSVLDRVRRTPTAERGGRTLLQAVDDALRQRGEAPPTESSLRERIAAWGWAETVCWLGARLGEALDHAHRRGVLHRDVKPANVLLTAEGAPLLADFNVSFSCKLDGANPAAFFGGSLAYMSPEQLEAFNPAHARGPGDLDGRADLYSLCMILWELLVGRRPFRDDALGGDWSAMLARMTARRRTGVGPEDVASLPAGLPAGLREVLTTGLDPEPARRPPTGAELALQLELCLRPRARALLHPPAGGWRGLARLHGLAAVLLAAIIPNVLGTLFNIWYNRSEIIARLPGADPAFWTVQAAINAVAFPLGIGLVAIFSRSATRAARQGDAAGPTPRRRCLVLGDAAAVVAVSEWVAAGAAFPLLLIALLGPQPPAFFLRFLTSLGLCGLMAAVYSFFGVTFLAVRALLPPLLRRHGLDAEDSGRLDGLKRRTGLYLALAGMAPMLAVAAWAALGSEDRAALGALSIVGVAGFAAAFALSRAIQGDLDALASAPGDSRTKSGP